MGLFASVDWRSPVDGALTVDWAGAWHAIYWFSGGALVCYFLDRGAVTVSGEHGN